MKKKGKPKTLKNLISFDRIDKSKKDEAKEVGLNLFYFYEVVEAGKKLEDCKLTEPEKDSIYMICYTSGTTGEPKAAMLSHGNLLAAAKGAKDADFNINENDIHLSYLPLAHSFEKIIFVTSLVSGG